MKEKGVLCLSPESLLEILDFNPGLFENPDQGSLLQFAVKRDGGRHAILSARQRDLKSNAWLRIPASRGT